MLAYVLILAVIAARLLLRPLAFAPVMPVLLLAGARLPRKMFWLPVALLTAADLYLTFAVYGAGFKADQFIVSAWYLAMLFLGSALTAPTKSGLSTSAIPIRSAGAPCVPPSFWTRI